MVSALTGRLYPCGEYSSGSDGGGAMKRKSEAVDVSSTSRSSGYAADVDQVGKSVPPFYVDFQAPKEGSMSTTKDCKLDGEGRHEGGRIGGFSSKRLRIVEKDYLAQNAYAELARGGLEVPKLQLNCPRLLPPLCGIDMSRVSLVKSSDFSVETPEMPVTEGNKEVCADTIISLAESCRDFYQLPLELKSERSDDQSITSSVTDAETDTNGSGNSDDDDDETAKGKKYSFMTMCDALSLCKQPRIVVLSTPPFTVVHANAAYLHTTGLSSMRLLGQPLQDFVVDKSWVSVLNGTTESRGAFDLKQMHREVVKMRTGSQKDSPLQCVIQASPIGIAHDRVTHFALGLEPSDGKGQVGEPEDNTQTPPMTVSG